MTHIYHNPRCSKSRETLALLQARVSDVQIIQYLDTPPDSATLQQLLDMLQFSDPRQLMRQKEDEFTQLNLANPALSHTELLAAMVAHPRLIERPIVVHAGRAAIGRPPEQILALFDY